MKVHESFGSVPIAVLADRGRIPVALTFFLVGMGFTFNCIDIAHAEEIEVPYANNITLIYLRQWCPSISALIERHAAPTALVVMARCDENAKRSLRRVGYNSVVEFPHALDILRDRLDDLRRLALAVAERDRMRAYRCENTVFDQVNRTLQGADARMELTVKENFLLGLLVRNANATVSRSAIDHCMGRMVKQAASRSTDVMVSTIRRKMRAMGMHCEIMAVHNSGYRLTGAWMPLATTAHDRHPGATPNHSDAISRM